MAVVASGGLLLLLDELDAGLAARLFQNAVTPTPGNVLGDFLPADFPGYADIPVSYAGAALDGIGRGKAQAAGLTWTRSAGAGTQTIFGWVLFNVASLRLVAADVFSPPRVISLPGQNITLALVNTLQRL